MPDLSDVSYTRAVLILTQTRDPHPPSCFDMTRLLARAISQNVSNLVKFAPRILLPTCDAIDPSAIRTHRDQKINRRSNPAGATSVVLFQPNLDLYDSLFVELNGHRCCTCSETMLKQASLRQFYPDCLSKSPLLKSIEFHSAFCTKSGGSRRQTPVPMPKVLVP